MCIYTSHVRLTKEFDETSPRGRQYPRRLHGSSALRLRLLSRQTVSLIFFVHYYMHLLYIHCYYSIHYRISISINICVSIYNLKYYCIHYIINININICIRIYIYIYIYTSHVRMRQHVGIQDQVHVQWRRASSEPAFRAVETPNYGSAPSNDI